MFSVDPSTGTTTQTWGSSNNDVITSLATGPDGRLWLTDTYDNEIDAVGTPAGVSSSSYYLPLPRVYPSSIIAGPDGNMWLTESGGLIVKMTLSGTRTAYSLPSGSYAGILTAGADGAVWFTETTGSGVKKIGRISTSGSITDYTVPSATSLGGLALAADNSIWYGYTQSGTYGLGTISWQ